MFDFDPSKMVKVSVVNPKALIKPKYLLKAVHNGKAVNYFVGALLWEAYNLEENGFSFHKDRESGVIAINIEAEEVAQVLKRTTGSRKKGKKFKADVLTTYLLAEELIQDTKGVYFLTLQDIENVENWALVVNDSVLENEVEESPVAEAMEVSEVDASQDNTYPEEEVLEEAEYMPSQA